MSEVESLQVSVRDEITNLGVLVSEAEDLLSNFFDVDMSGEFKREHVQQCKVKLQALRAEIVALGSANLNEEESKRHDFYIDKFDILRVEQQGMEDFLFGDLDGPGRMAPLGALILGMRPGYQRLTCRLGRYDPNWDTHPRNIRSNVSISTIVEESDRLDLSSTILERTIPFLECDLGNLYDEIEASPRRCVCGILPPTLSMEIRAVVNNISPQGSIEVGVCSDSNSRKRKLKDI